VSTSADLIDIIVREFVAPPLKLAKFTKTARTWHRDLSHVVQVVNVQGSAWNGPGARFTLNVGLWFPAVTKLVRDKPLTSRRVPEYSCTVRRRIGALMPGGEDHWWDVAGGATDTVGTEVRGAVEDLALPWLARYADPADALAYLRSTNYAYASPVDGFALALSLNDNELARTLYREWMASLDRPAPALVEWAEAHGLA
jgi:hypothetical protein